MNEKSFAAKNDPVNLALAEHLCGCQKCAAQYAANDILNRAINFERAKTIENETPLSFMKTRIETFALQQTKEHVTMSSLKSKFMNHPIMSFGFLGVVAALLIMAVIPVSCSREVGYSVGVTDGDHSVASAITSDAEGTASITFQNSADGKSISLEPQRMVKALETLGIKNAKIEVKADQNGKTINLSGLNSREEARDALLAIVEIAGLGGKVELSTRQASVDGSLLEQALNGIRELVFSSEGKSDEQMRNEIAAALEEAGVIGADVQYMTGDDGQKMIFIGNGNGDDSIVVEQAFNWVDDGSENGAPGDTTMVIEINSGEKGETVDVKKTITLESDN